MITLQELMDDISSWSDMQFGQDQRTPGIVHHLVKEVAELLDALKKTNSLIEDEEASVEELSVQIGNTKYEFADCFMLLLDAATHYNIGADELIRLAYKKLEINKHRRWGKPDKNGVVEHIRKEEQ